MPVLDLLCPLHALAVGGRKIAQPAAWVEALLASGRTSKSHESHHNSAVKRLEDAFRDNLRSAIQQALELYELLAPKYAGDIDSLCQASDVGSAAGNWLLHIFLLRQ